MSLGLQVEFDFEFSDVTAPFENWNGRATHISERISRPGSSATGQLNVMPSVEIGSRITSSSSAAVSNWNNDQTENALLFVQRLIGFAENGTASRSNFHFAQRFKDGNSADVIQAGRNFSSRLL